jgi:UDP-glucose 4-epimerase
VVANPAKAQSVLGWTAKRNLADIVSSAWMSMQKGSSGSITTGNAEGIRLTIY